MELALGPNVELLVWIPKKGDALDVDQQRPLMLPTTLRRLCEAVTVAAVAPLIEPTLSAWQAARLGGSCRENISA
eukprot:13704123-Alexandrium_andersonii.AAC.1